MAVNVRGIVHDIQGCREDTLHGNDQARDLAVVLVFICPETVHYLKTLRPILKEKIVKAAEGFESFKVLSIERVSEVRYLPSLSLSHIVPGVMLLIIYLPM